MTSFPRKRCCPPGTCPRRSLRLTSHIHILGPQNKEVTVKALPVTCAPPLFLVRSIPLVPYTFNYILPPTNSIFLLTNLQRKIGSPFTYMNPQSTHIFSRGVFMCHCPFSILRDTTYVHHCGHDVPECGPARLGDSRAASYPALTSHVACTCFGCL